MRNLNSLTFFGSLTEFINLLPPVKAEPGVTFSKSKMKKHYWIVGDWDKIIEEEQLEQNAIESSKKGNYEQFSDSSGKIIYRRRKLGNRTVLIEFNTSTGKKLLLTPLEEALGKDILRPELSDVFLDFISKKSKALGYWPLREINLPRQ